MIDNDMELINFFEFYDDGECCSNDVESYDDDDSVAENRAFWQMHGRLLQESLSRSHSIERHIRTDIEQALSRLRSGDEACRGHCVLRDVVNSLRERGYNGALCKSKWKRTSETPSGLQTTPLATDGSQTPGTLPSNVSATINGVAFCGEHCFIDVTVEPKNGKKEPARIVVELEFRAEFEMARASADYSSLVRSLPEIFVGRPERLRSVIRIMCEAAKKSAKDNKMHIAPWRKHRYMQSKWLGTWERVKPGPVPIAAAPNQPTKPTASMLTFDLRCTNDDNIICLYTKVN